jgi:hypothetical protein
VPNEHAENAGTRKRRHPEEPLALDPLENSIDVKQTLWIEAAQVAFERTGSLAERRE